MLIATLQPVTYTNTKSICTLSVSELSHAGVFTWWQRLFELLCLLLVSDDECVQVPAAAHLKLHIVLVLLDLNSYKGTNISGSSSRHTEGY